MKTKKYSKIEKLFKKNELLSYIRERVKEWGIDMKGGGFRVIFQPRGIGEDKMVKYLYNQFLKAVSEDFEAKKELADIYGLNFSFTITDNDKIQKILFPEIVIITNKFKKSRQKII